MPRSQQSDETYVFKYVHARSREHCTESIRARTVHEAMEVYIARRLNEGLSYRDIFVVSKLRVTTQDDQCQYVLDSRGELQRLDS